MSEIPNIRPVICIAGPTASGKSALAVNLAHKCRGEVINADSMQVYKDLQVLSARPDAAEMEGVPHHMYGHIDGQERYSVGAWVKDVVPVIMDCLARDKTPILVGGTGLYFKALTEGLAAVPQPEAGAMAQAEAMLDAGIDILREKANALDPVATTRVLGNDPQRLLRIVSVALGTDKPLSVWQKETRPVIPKQFWKGALILPERQSLYDKINARYDKMVEIGGLEEAKDILLRDLPADLPMMKAIGLPSLLKYLRGEVSYDLAVFEAKRDTRRFAKRQFTWFRGQTKGWTCLGNNCFEKDFGKILREL